MLTPTPVHRDEAFLPAVDVAATAAAEVTAAAGGGPDGRVPVGNDCKKANQGSTLCFGGGGGKINPTYQDDGTCACVVVVVAAAAAA